MDNKKYPFAALVVAAGSGQRFGDSDIPKQYMPLLGRAVLRWSVDALLARPDVGTVCVVIRAEDRARCHDALAGIAPDRLLITEGGATRQQSVLYGLEALAAQADNKPVYVLIHDAARPCVTPDVIGTVCAALQSGAIAAVPALPVTDTLRRRTQNGATATEPREGLYAIQTPQGFALEDILSLHRRFADDSLTDDAALVERDGRAVELTRGAVQNIKITWPDDLARAEALLAAPRGDIRTGKGYDVHRLVTPRDAAHRLMIGGIEISYDKALDGHSDADVALHAITDALLGTICDGDIGMHFSPKDARWKNADSAMFLAHAASMLAAQNGVIAHVDLTVICETPKIGPHRDAMRARIAGILHLPLRRVSVKATTTEGLGFTGRGEGIAAEAVVTVRLPMGFDTGAENAHNVPEPQTFRKAV